MTQSCQSSPNLCLEYSPKTLHRYSATLRHPTLPTRNTFTGQYSYVSDDATDLGSSGFGLMFYQSRWYDPASGRFSQADTIVPGGVQGLDRYAYVNNSPLNYVDPSGHFGRCHDGQSGYQCRGLMIRQYGIGLIGELESTYGIDIKGNWSNHELELLMETLSAYADYVGGADQLKAIFQAAAEKLGVGRVGFARVQSDTTDGIRQKPQWCNVSSCGDDYGYIRITSDVFTSEYQQRSIGRIPMGLSTDQGAMVTIGHEIGHVFDEVFPAVKEAYMRFFGPDFPYPLDKGDMPAGITRAEENLATTLALYVTTGNSWHVPDTNMTLNIFFDVYRMVFSACLTCQ